MAREKQSFVVVYFDLDDKCEINFVHAKGNCSGCFFYIGLLVKNGKMQKRESRNNGVLFLYTDEISQKNFVQAIEACDSSVVEPADNLHYVNLEWSTWKIGVSDASDVVASASQRTKQHRSQAIRRLAAT